VITLIGFALRVIMQALTPYHHLQRIYVALSEISHFAGLPREDIKPSHFAHFKRTAHRALSHCLSPYPSTSRTLSYHGYNTQKISCRRYVLPSTKHLPFRTSLILEIGSAADTRSSTNAWSGEIAAQYRNESTPVGSYDSSNPITLESPKTGREERKIEAGRKRGSNALNKFDHMFNDPPRATKPSKAKTT
jgi:hypothetical protein